MVTKEEAELYTEPYEKCSRFYNCSCNSCPLHPDYLKLEVMPDDKEKKCKQRKSVRQRIAEQFKLKNGGLTKKEQSYSKYWDSLSSEQKEAKKQKLRESSPFLQLKQKNYAIVRVPKDTSKFTQENNQKLAKSSIPQTTSPNPEEVEEAGK